MLRVMFICTANSCRSQMAEGFARELGRGIVDPYSAGLIAVEVQTRAVAVMREVGIDITAQRPKIIDEGLLRKMDMVITLCDSAAEYCPVTPVGVTRLHWPVKDPVGTIGTEERIMREFRRARDEIRERIAGLLDHLRETEEGGQKQEG